MINAILTEEQKITIADIFRVKSDKQLLKEGSPHTRVSYVDNWLKTGFHIDDEHRTLQVYQYLESIGVELPNPYESIQSDEPCLHDNIYHPGHKPSYCRDCGQEF